VKTVDFLIAGGGGAGLGLAWAMAHSPLRGASILVVDPAAKDQNDRTWCFWGDASAPFASLACYSWSKVRVIGEGFERTFDLGDWRYWMVRGIDYYSHTRRCLEALPGVEFRQGSLERIEDGPAAARAVVDGEPISAGYIFDSAIRPGDLAREPARYHYLKQHFMGWEIETKRELFDPHCATLFDFRTEQKGALRFFYILPFSTRRALVEYTLFSAEVLSREEYESKLRDYIGGVLGLEDYRVLSEENGVIPMTDHPFQRKAAAHVLNIGTKGGMVKPSTGYAFARMQRDALAVVRSLIRFGNPFSIPAAPARYRLFDSILLQILYRHGGAMKGIFLQLFRRNPIRRILRFLDERSSWWEDLLLIASLPPAPFLQALLKRVLTHRV
jgi:lycopene beta-cyclase